MSHTLTDEIERAVLNILTTQRRTPLDTLFFIDADVLESHLRLLLQNFQSIADSIQSGHIPPSFANPPSISLGPPVNLGSPSALHQVYDSLTSDPQQPPPATSPDAEKPTSPTNIPLDDLRFANWTSIHEVIALASRYEAARTQAVDQYLATGRIFHRAIFDMNLSAYYEPRDVNDMVKQIAADADAAEAEAEADSATHPHQTPKTSDIFGIHADDVNIFDTTQNDGLSKTTDAEKEEARWERELSDRLLRSLDESSIAARESQSESESEDPEAGLEDDVQTVRARILALRGR